jgi:hypothetical protein
VIGAPTRPLFRLLETNDGTTIHQFDFNFSDVTRFAVANSIESGSNMSYNMGIAYTPTGITVDPAVVVGTQKLTNFIYDDATGNFTATGTNNVTATIKYSKTPLVLTDDYKILLKGQLPTAFGYIHEDLKRASTNSPLFNNLVSQINASLPNGVTIEEIDFLFNQGSNKSNYIFYYFSDKTYVFHYFRTTENATDKTIVLTHRFWANATAIIPEPTYLSEIDKQFMDAKGLYVKKESFKINQTNIYTFTSTSNPFRITTYAFQ